MRNKCLINSLIFFIYIEYIDPSRLLRQDPPFMKLKKLKYNFTKLKIRAKFRLLETLHRVLWCLCLNASLLLIHSYIQLVVCFNELYHAYKFFP